MSLLDKLKALFGLGQTPRQSGRRRDVGVTVEHEPGDAEPDAESEAAVKGVDVAETPSGRDPDAGGAEPETADESTPETVDIPDAEELASETDEEEPDEAEEAAEEAPDEAGEVPEPAEEGPGAVEEEPEPAAEEPEAAGEATEAAEPEPEAAGEPTESVKGIGTAYADRLADANVETVADLAAADPDALAEETGISESRLERWIERARDR